MPPSISTTVPDNTEGVGVRGGRESEREKPKRMPPSSSMTVTKLLVYEALRYYCMRPYATSV
jgi:hypothetical protein